jgi:hypothetical protein
MVATFQSELWLWNGLMKILLQNKHTRDYVNQGGGWTRKQGRARVFDDGMEAFSFCLDRRILRMQLVCVFPDLAQNFTLAVTDSRQGS